MKINKQKHGKENTIGKIIYGFLMFMPLLAIAVTCAYVIFNKNAKDSFSDKQIYQQFVIQNETQWVDNVVLNAKYKAPLSQASANFTFNISYISYTYDDLNITQAQYDSITKLYFVKTGDRFQFRNSDNQVVTEITWNNEIDFNFISSDSSVNSNFFNVAYITETILVQEELDNVFYYSIDKVEQSPLFSWATNTGTHDVLESTCQTLGITTPFVPMLLAYWLMMSLMYLLYDIALLVVHMAHNRIHDIESSI